MTLNSLAKNWRKELQNLKLKGQIGMNTHNAPVWIFAIETDKM